MGFWIYMTLLSLLIPTVMLIVGIRFSKVSPKQINYVFGYRTARSMKNQGTWQFAHNYCGKLWIIMAIALFPICIIAMLCCLNGNENVVGSIGAAVTIFPFLPIALSVVLTERALKQNFDEHGNRKASSK